jgi:hypothetical protein
VKESTNNFEKWKRDMTVEKFLAIFKKTGCVGCPAEEVCKVTEGCENAFIKWAQMKGGDKNDGY